MRRNTSASVRTVVVLPVPPFRDRTVIVSAMDAGTIAAYRLLLRECRGGRVDRSADGGGVEVVQRVAADQDLVAVGQRAPLHAPPVDRDAVERAVVEHAHAVAL